MTLSTENALTSGFVGSTINTKNNNYGPVQFGFDKVVDDNFGSVSSLYGSASVISITAGKMNLNYKTPNRADDVLTFAGIKVSGVENTTPVSYQVLGLLEETNFNSFLSPPTSQNYSYNLQAEFSKPISTCSSITASSGTPTTIIPSVVDGKVRFSWSSLNTATIKFIFNGLTSTDGSIDANITGLEETHIINLYSPPEISGWFSEQPLSPSTAYNLSVQFNKALDNSMAPTITSSEAGVNPVFTSFDGNKVNFSLTTGSNPGSAIYTLSNVKSLEGGITSNTTISVGPYLTKTEVEIDEANTFTESEKLVKLRTQRVKLTLSKDIIGTLALQSNINCAFSSITMINQRTAQFQITPVDNGVGQLFLTIQTSSLTAYDGSNTTSISKTFDLVYSQTLIKLFDSSNLNTEDTEFDVGTAVDLSLEVSKPIDADISNTTLVSSNGTHNGNLTTSTILGKYYYNFNFSPTAAGTDQWIKIQQAKDWDNFIYNLTKNGLTFKSDLISGGLFFLDAEIDSHFTLSGSNVIPISSSGISSSNIYGNVARNTLSSGKNTYR